MKTTTLLLIMLFLSKLTFTQEINFTFSPMKNGLGVIYSKSIQRISILTSVENGQYRIENEKISILKCGVGLGYLTKDQNEICLILQHNYLYNVHTVGAFTVNKVNKFSLEPGVIHRFNERMRVSLFYDLINKEGRFGFGFNLRK